MGLNLLRSILLWLILAFTSHAEAQEADGTLTFDIGIASGSYEKHNYTEGSLVSTSLNGLSELGPARRPERFVYSNEDSGNAYGIDTSVRGLATLGDQDLGVVRLRRTRLSFCDLRRYRSVRRGRCDPSCESDFVWCRVRSFLNSLVRPGAENDTQVMLILSGGGVIF